MDMEMSGVSAAVGIAKGLSGMARYFMENHQTEKSEGLITVIHGLFEAIVEGSYGVLNEDPDKLLDELHEIIYGEG